MTREEHIEVYERFRKIALDALRAFGKDPSKTNLWETYKKFSREANKHYGIAQAMHTKAMKKAGYYR